METIKHNIEKALLDIYNSVVKPFDFYSTLKSLERKNDADFGLYIAVFKDLFSVIGHAWLEYKSITQKGGKYIVVKELNCVFKNLPPKKEQLQNIYTQQELNQRFETLDIQILNESPKTYPITKLFFLYPEIGKRPTNEMLKLSIYIESKQKIVTENIVFEEYIKELKMQHSEIPDNVPVLNFADYLKHPEPGKHLSDEQKNELMLKIKNEFPKGKDSEAAIMIFALTVCELFPESINQTDVIKAIKNEWKTEFDEAFRKKLRELNKIKASKETRQKEEYKGDVISAISKIRSMCQQMKL